MGLQALFHKADNGRIQTPSEAFNMRFLSLVFFSAFGALCFGYDLAFIGGTFALESFINRFGLTAENSVDLKTNMVSTCECSTADPQLGSGADGVRTQSLVEPSLAS